MDANAAKPSRTAIWVAAWRGLDRFEKHAIVQDPFADLLVPTFPYGLALRVARQLPGVTSRVLASLARWSAGHSRHMAYRTRAIDDAIERAVKDDGCRQLVILGAGLDARAWRMDALRESTVFEVDHPSTQAFKRGRVGGLPARAREVRFVGVDFERDDLRARLTESGYRTGDKAFFIWEGVTMYLTLDAIHASLRVLSDMAAPGSKVAVTYHRNVHSGPLGTLVNGVREPFLSRFSAEEMREILEGHDFRLESDEADADWSQRYLGITVAFEVERLATGVRTDRRSAQKHA